MSSDLGLERRKEALAWIYLAGIVALSCYLRFANLRATPGWDADEGYNVSIAQNLEQGRAQIFSLRIAYVDHPLLFFSIAAVAFRLWGSDILTLRQVAAACGVLATVVLILFARAHFGRRIGLLSAGLFAIFPLAVAYNRLGYGYNLLMLITTLYILAQARWLRSGRARDLLLAALLAALGLLTEQEGLYLPLALVTLLLWRRRFRQALAVAGLAVGIPLVATLLLALPRWSLFVSDLGHAVSRAASGGVVQHAVLLFVGYEQYFEVHYWLLPGLVGLCLVRPACQRRGLLVLAAFMLAAVLKVRDVNPFFRTAVPTLPLICLGLSTLIQRGLEVAYPRAVAWFQCLWAAAGAGRWSGRAARPSAALAAFILLFSPLAGAAIKDGLGVTFGLRMAIDPYLARDVSAAQAAIDYINQRVGPDDVVLASPQIAWALRCRSADLMQAVAFQGLATAFYPAGLPRRRFAFEPSLSRARFVVIDEFLRRWAQEMPAERALLADAGSWPRVFQDGEYEVHERPA